MKKRVISLVLALVMLFTMLPSMKTAVFATGRYSVNNTKNVTGQDIVLQARKWANSGSTYWSHYEPWEESIYWRTGYTYSGQTSFDCSGFVSRVLNDCGFRASNYTPSYGTCILSQTYGSGYIGISIEELVNYGTDITDAVIKAKNGDYSDLQLGDIIGWTSGSLGRHIIIYAGMNNGQPWMVEFTGSGYYDRAITSSYQGAFQYGARFVTSNKNVPQAESASFISRSDGVWFWPTTSYAVSDWAGCNASPNVNSYCYFCGVQHGLCGANHLTTLGHNGVDIPVGVGSDVYAAASGTLYCTNYDWPSRGITAVVEHPIVGTNWSYYSIYQHLQSTATAKNGTTVSAGEVIAWSGNTDGYGSGQAHLHFGILMGASGQGNALAQSPNSNISAIENCGWITTSGYATGRILPNPALNSPAGNPTYTDGCESNVRLHAGSVMYTRNKAEVNIGCGDSAPVCAYDVATGGVNSVFVRGWAYDPDTPDESVQIQVYMDGEYIGSGVANTWREDVHEVHGCGNMHGFDITLPVNVTETGNHLIRVYALNTNTAGGNKDMGEKEVTITAHSHSYSESVTKAATCTEPGEKTFTCESCADTYTEEIPVTGHNYIAEVTGATCTTAGYTTYTCDRCSDSYVEQADGWSAWSTEYPAGIPENLIEQKTQYSVLEKEYTSSANATLDGWTNIGTTHGDWGAVLTTTTKPAESDILRITNTTQTGWGYYHWCSYYSGTYCIDSIQVNGSTQSELHGYTSSFELPAYTIPDQGGQQSYGGDGNGAAACPRNFYVWFRNPDTDTYTYSYQTRSVVNEFYKWSDKWSDWSDEAVTENEDRQVKTQIVYRYYISEFGVHNYGQLAAKEPATCMTAGLKAHYYCTDCRKYFDENKNEVAYADLIIPVTGHTYGELVAEVPAQIGQTGMKAHYYDVDCGRYFDENKNEVAYSDLIIPALPEPTEPEEPTNPEDTDEMKNSGTCGENLTWVLDDTGVLRISGTGKMEDYYAAHYAEGAPWFDQRSAINEVVIEDGVTSIGWYAFYKCDKLTSVNIPDSVTSINNHAFMYCTSLTSITIPDSITSLGEYAFLGCSSLISITIPNSINTIPRWVFQNCTSLTSVTIPDSVTSIGIDAFRGCTSLTSVTIGDSITSIDQWAFYECNSLKDVYYCGTEEQWNAITIGKWNEPFTNATIHYNTSILLQTMADGKEIIVGYATLEEALAVANSGTIKLLADTTVDTVVLRPGVTLDLNGYTLTANVVLVMKNAVIIDGGTTCTGGGFLKVSKDNLVYAPGGEREVIAVWNGVDGYLFTKVTFQQMVRKAGTVAAQYIFLPSFSNTEAVALMADGGADNGLKIKVGLEWNDGQCQQFYTYEDSLVEQVFASGGRLVFSLTVTGIGGIADMTASATVVTDSGAQATATGTTFTAE